MVWIFNLKLREFVKAFIKQELKVELHFTRQYHSFIFFNRVISN